MTKDKELYYFDYKNKLKVTFNNKIDTDLLLNIGNYELFNGVNLAIYGNEIIQFKNVVLNENGTYTNSYEALIQNYNLGHRVFEFDFMPTSDNNLALVHDWYQFGYQNNMAMSSEEWKSFEAYGGPKTDSRYTSMLIGDLLDEMLVNKDIYVVTDGKIDSEGARLEFQVIYEEAMKRDPELLNRIVPQIYNNEMYDVVMGIYEFPSIIYTTYATTLTAQEIIEFCKLHDNIDMIAAHDEDVRFDAITIEEIHNNGMMFFVHTINTYNEITINSSRGCDGFYTDLLLPSDLEVYNRISGKR